MDQLNVTLTVIGGIVLLLGLFSAAIKRSSLLAQPLAAVGLGVLFGPAGLGLISLIEQPHAREILEQACRLTLAVGLLGVAMRLPPLYPKYAWRSLLAILGLIMPLMWLTSGVLVWAVTGLDLWMALLVGAVITPTDPIIASAIVTGPFAVRHLPRRLRNIMSVEAGSNDGLAYPFVLLCILMLGSAATGEALRAFAVEIVLREVLGAAFIGGVIGYAAGRLLRLVRSRGLMGRTSQLGYTIALSLVVLGGAKLLQTDGILAVFVAGLAFDPQVDRKELVEADEIQEAINRFFMLPVFVLLGASLPWGGWAQLGWKAPVLVASVLLARRLPWVVLLRRVVPRLRRPADAWFDGWFGPIGIAALFYATLAVRETGRDEPWVMGSLMIAASVAFHGLSATPLTRLYSHVTDRMPQTGQTHMTLVTRRGG